MSKLEKGESIVTAWAEYAEGPGWSNTPVWVLVRAVDGKLRIECLQPDEQGSDLCVLYDPSAAIHTAMRRAVERDLKPKRGP